MRELGEKKKKKEKGEKEGTNNVSAQQKATSFQLREIQKEGETTTRVKGRGPFWRFVLGIGKKEGENEEKKSLRGLWEAASRPSPRRITVRKAVSALCCLSVTR